MRLSLLPAVLAAAVTMSLPGPAGAAPGDVHTVEGEVMTATSRWAHGGTSIVTELEIRSSDGATRTVHQLGGSVDGIGMVVLHAPPPLAPGARVSAAVVEQRAASGRTILSLRKVQPLTEPRDQQRHDFVRTLTKKTLVPTYWAANCAFLRYNEDGTSHVAGDGEFAVLRESAGRWNVATQSCGYLELISEGRDDGEVGFDGINRVVFREETWCRPAIGEDPAECYDPAAAGVTTLFFVDDENSDRNGEIVDADIELNAVDFAISVDGQTTEPPSRCKADLANTFTHELGHLMGLDHTCFSGDGPHLRDGEGQLIPRCSDSLPDRVVDATMFNFQGCGETKKASPEEDDIAGICAIYPSEADPGFCERPDITQRGCCAVAGETSRRAGPIGSVALVLGFACLMLLARRRG